MRSAELPARVLAFLRSRLLGAVLMPALVGAAWVARHGPVQLPRLAFALVGLAAAELLNLFGADYAVHLAARRGGSGQGTARGLLLPGNPVVRPSRLPPARLPFVLAPIALVGLAAMLYFTLAVGPGVLLFFLAAALVGALYVLEPCPCAFLSTAAIPPLITGGVALALTGRVSTEAFWAGLPIAWISLGVILGYRWVYAEGGRRRGGRRGLMLGVYAAGGLNVVVLWLAGIYPVTALGALLVVLVFVVLVARAAGREPRDPIPATALGVLMHTLSSLALALALAIAWA